MKEKFERVKTYQDHLDGLKKIVEDWVKVGESKTKGLYEDDVRQMEGKLVPEFIKFFEEHPELLEANREELRFVIEEYLRIGEWSDLMKEAGALFGLKSYDPFTDAAPEPGEIAPDLAAGQVLREIREMEGEDDSNKGGGVKKALDDTSKANKKKTIH